MSGILILIDHLKGQVTDTSFEMLGVARQIGDAMKWPVQAVVLAKEATPLCAALGAADAVLTLENPQLEMPSSEVVATLLQNLAEKKNASLVLIAGTNVAMGIGARLAFALKWPFVNFCKGLKADGGGAFSFTSQLFGGKILADVRLPELRGVVGIYPGSFAPDAGRSTRPPTIERVELPLQASPIVFRKFIEPESTDVDITKQNVLVAVGRGIQTEDNLPMAQELADLLKGAVCASRPVIDQGWLPLTRQVGKSGMSVKPKLYLAAGISGAPEHVEGMKNADLTIAINTDPNAPIFEVARYGVCGDALEIMPALVESIKARKGNN